MSLSDDRLKALDILIEENKKLLKKYPNRFSLKLALESKLQHRKVLLTQIEENKPDENFEKN